MKKTFRSILSIAIVLCLLSTSLFTGTLALSSSANDLRKQIVSAIDGLQVTADTTADDIAAAVTTVAAEAEINWSFAFQKVLPTNGAIITLNGKEVEGGLVRGHNGSIKGILNITVSGENFDVVVDRTIEPTYETIDCTKQATVTISSSADQYSIDDGYSDDADLVVINMGSGQWNIPNNYFESNSTVKAIIITSGIANVLDKAFYSMQGLQAVVFQSVTGIYSNAFYATAVKYVEFGSAPDATLIISNPNAFAWSTINNLYIGGYNSVKVRSGAFTGCSQMKQLVIDTDTVSEISSDSLNTKSDGKSCDTTVVCNDSVAAEIFTTAGVSSIIDLSKNAIFEYYNKVSNLTVVDDATAEGVIASAKALDTADAFKVTAEKKDNMFEVTITDANDVTVTAYLETVAAVDVKNTVQTLVDEYDYTSETTQDDINTAVVSALGVGYDIIWLEDYSYSSKVDGAEVWARKDENSEYTLYGTVPGQDNAVHGSFVIKKANESIVIKINKVFEKAEYEKYELTGVQTTNGSNGGNAAGAYKTTYDGTSQLVIVTGDVGINHLSAVAIDEVLGAGVSSNIKAVIVEGKPNDWNCFYQLKGLEVAIINNTTVTNLGNQQFRECENLKYVYLPDNVVSVKISGNKVSQTAFWGCIKLNPVLVSENFDKTSINIYRIDSSTVAVADTVTRYTEDAEASALLAFYDEVSAIPSAASVEEIEAKLAVLPSYSENYEIAVTEGDSGFTVAINELLYVNIPVTTPEGIKGNVTAALSEFIASNTTTAEDIENAVIGVPGVLSVEWSDTFGFQKILATNGAQITLNGNVVEGGIVRGWAGSITGVVTVNTSFGDSFDAKVAITIDPVYETIDCTKSATVTVTSDTDKYSTSAGYNAAADLVIINVTNPNKNIPANYLGATSNATNTTVKAVIVRDPLTTVLEKAFWYTSALEAVVFSELSSLNNQAFYAASAVKYVDFGSGTTFNFGNANTFGWCQQIEGLYIADRASVNFGNNTFDGCKKLAQIYVDAETVTNVSTNAVNSNGNANGSVTTVVCNGADAVSKFEAAGALAVIDAAAREISVYDVNYDFGFDARDLVRLKKMIAALSNDINYDINGDGDIDSIDLIEMRQELLGVSKKK